MGQWQVGFESEKIAKEYQRLFRNGDISKDDNKIILKWIYFVEEFGPEKLIEKPYWNDHALDGEWLGHRSSSFSHLGRIIYKIVDNKLIVKVVKITHEHDYKR